MATGKMGRAGLLWIGEQFYKSPAAFTEEADRMGISRRIAAVPRGFKVGETWILLAHPKGAPCEQCNGAGLVRANGAGQPGEYGQCESCRGAGKVAGIFRVFRPSSIEKILTESQATPEALAELAERGITAVVVPDNDRDHQGTVYDDPTDDGIEATQ